ncbi:MAG: hypothetical protein HKN22_03400, partial [Bacteroidia bacterium]|nr:hypothetical protein [Bacteroidia bacterium]
PLGVSFADYNNDMYPDIFVAIDHYFGNNLYLNNGDGTFTDVSDSSRFDKAKGGKCVAQGDYNNDGLIDIYVSNVPQIQHGNELFKNNGDGTFDTTAWSNNTKVHLHGWGSNMLDYDNDGLMDIFTCNSAGGPNISVNLNRRNVLLKNLGPSGFMEVTTGDIILDTIGVTYGTAMGDYNNDGFYDLVVLNNDSTISRVYRNDGNLNNYLKFRLTGTVTNRDAVGVHIKVYNQGVMYSRYTYCGISYGSQNSKDVIVGIGETETVDSVYIMWPSFITDKFYNLNSDQLLEIEEGEVACASKMNLTTTKQNVSCAGANNGQCSVFASGGTPPYFYQWETSPPSSTQSIYNQGGGEKLVEVKDDNNCVMKTSINIFEPSPLFVTAISDFPEPGDINLLVSGGVAPYSYTWSTGATTEDVTGLGPGMYFVQVTDNNSCAKVHLVNLY